MVIRGGSAGGYTTLAALAFRDVFAAGASHFGVADAAALARDTHKFESRYLDGLIGPWPEAKRSTSSDRRSTTPTASTARSSSSRDSRTRSCRRIRPRRWPTRCGPRAFPFAYLAFEGEQHGFRKAETIVRVAEAELSFYGQVFGFAPADEMEPVVIENADALNR